MAVEFVEKLRTHIRAGYPLLYLVTAEEDRAIELAAKAVADGELSRRKLYLWSVSRGLCMADGGLIDKKLADPARILPYLLEMQEPGVFILKDFHPYIDDRSPAASVTIRQLRDLIAPFKAARKTVILLSPVLQLPPGVEKDAAVLDLELPSETELAAVLDETVEQMKENPKISIALKGDGRGAMVRALSGLTRSEAENALAKVIVANSRIDSEDVVLLLSEKEQVIRKSGMLEYYPTPESFGSIGGLDELKSWLRARGRAFSDSARAFGLPSPKGILLVGVPGCGKSLTAKAIAAEWKMPLLRFDLGKVFGGLVGQSESNMRNAIKVAEAVAPCILWIDEIEKGLAGSRGLAGDSGVAQRVFGALLTWMEENKKQVFIIATANDIEGLPPEFLRKGRFDEIFFVDLPQKKERADILAIHLSKHRRDEAGFNLEALAAASQGFSGSELEQVVVSALYDAFSEGEGARLEDRHLAKAIAESVPLSQSMAKRIERLRDEAREKWRWASGSPDKRFDLESRGLAPAETSLAAKRPRRVVEM